MEYPFHLLGSYSSLQVFFFGCITALSFTGTGKLALERLSGKKVPLLYSLPTGTLLGTLMFSLLVQLVGFTRLASADVLKGIWCVQTFLGGMALLHSLMRLPKKSPIASVSKRIVACAVSKIDAAIMCIWVLLLASTLFISLAPSTKIDELYYHMQVPLRFLQDGGLFYYREPWPAMIPHMHYQIAAAPLYALGVVDALNVTSWWLGAIFAWFCAAVVLRKGGDLPRALIVSMGMYSGMYAPVWFVTGGAGAVSVLSMAVLVFAALERQKMVGCLGGFTYVFFVSILSTALASSKLSYLPFAALCLTICSFSVWREFAYKQTFKIVFLAWSAWIVFYLPSLLWTWISSGYPLGAMQDPAFAEIISSTRLVYHSLHGFVTQMAIHFADHTPLVWGGCLLFLVSPTIRKARKVWLIGVALLFFQGIVITLKLPLSPRFFGGLPHGVALYFWMDAVRNAPAFFIKPFASIHFKAALLALMTPWLCVQLWYSAQFLPVILSAEPVESFAEKLIPFYEDFRKLDELLPEDALLFVDGAKVPSVYSPRPIIFEQREIKTKQRKNEIFSFVTLKTDDTFALHPLDIVYENETAKHFTFRTPGRAPILGPLAVYRLGPADTIKVKE